MSFRSISLVAIAATMCVGGAMAASLKATSASAVNATLSVAGVGSDSFINQLPATVTVPPAKTVTAKKSNFSVSHTYFGQLAFQATAKLASDVAKGTNVTNGSLSATGTSTIAGPAVTVKSGSNTVLTSSATSISSSSKITRTASGTGTPATTVTLKGLNLSSALFGITITNKTLTTTKQVTLATNSAKTVSIIANHQTPIKTAGKVTGMTVDAIDIQLTNFVYGPYKISGNIAVGTSTAK